MDHSVVPGPCIPCDVKKTIRDAVYHSAGVHRCSWSAALPIGPAGERQRYWGAARSFGGTDAVFTGSKDEAGDFLFQRNFVFLCADLLYFDL